MVGQRRCVEGAGCHCYCWSWALCAAAISEKALSATDVRLQIRFVERRKEVRGSEEEERKKHKKRERERGTQRRLRVRVRVRVLTPQTFGFCFNNISQKEEWNLFPLNELKNAEFILASLFSFKNKVFTLLKKLLFAYHSMSFFTNY